MIEACPNAGLKNCPYRHKNPPSVLRGQPTGCYSNTDHIVPQRLARLPHATELEKAYIYSDANKRQLCKWLHDIKNDNYDSGYPMPTVQEMIIALTVQFEENPEI